LGKKKRSMEDIQQQLAALRRRVAGIDASTQRWNRAVPGGVPGACRARRATSGRPRYFIEELMSGEVVTTPHGEHLETEKVWERHRRHGSVVSRPGELPDDLLGPLSAGTVERAHPLNGLSSIPRPPAWRAATGT